MPLFWRLFLTLSLSFSLIALITAGLIHLVMQQQSHLEQRFNTLQQQGSIALAIYLNQGTKSYHTWLRQAMHQQHAQLTLINAAGEAISKRPLPPEAHALIERLQQGETDIRMTLPDKIITAGRILESTPTWYWLAQQRLPPAMIEANQRLRSLTFIIMTLLTILISSLIISRMITRPIRQLQHTTHQLGEGNFKARTPISLSQRHDELGELGRDFNAMSDQLERLITRQKQLLRDISHELRSPLARMQFALALARPQHPADTPELDRIELEANRMNDLIEEVLTLARFDQGSIAFQHSNTLCHTLLYDLAQDLHFEAQSRPCQIHLSCAEGIHVDGDARWLKRAIENVARNAIHHTMPNTRVEISLYSQAEHAIITIRDHGAGVPEAALPHLFEPFYRVSESRERHSGKAAGGYGVGLAMVKHVITAHHGTIQSQNHRDGGFIITLSLPISPNV